MMRVYIALVFLGISIILKVATKDINSNESNNFDINVEDKISNLERALFDLTSMMKKEEIKNKVLEQRVLKVELKNEVLEKKNQNLEKTNKDINDELSYLKELSKLNVVRTCEEMADYGVNQSNFYLVDPDGPLLGEEPIRVYCDFSEGSVSTIISHDSEVKIEVGHCTDPGCYSRQITYDAPMEQIQSLIELSNTCSQEITYNCFLSPLQDEGVNYGFWKDKNGEDQIYWTDSHFGEHVCSCHYTEEGCLDEETLGNTCNCDSNKPSELSDVGIITNSSALPIMELRFGGLEFDAQSAFHTLGKLSCHGKRTNEPKPASCSSLKRNGYFKSGFFNVKEDGQFSKLVYCDMASLGYDNVDEEYIESSESHFDELEQYLGDYVSRSNNHFSLLDKNISDIDNKIENNISGSIVFSFYAYDGLTIAAGSYLTFHQSVVNDGNVFNGDTGTFTCSVNGYYEFTFTGNAYSTSQTYIKVEKNGNNARKFLDHLTDSLMSFTWIMKLSVGDTIRLYVEHGFIYRDSYHNSAFNGMLLRAT